MLDRAHCWQRYPSIRGIVFHLTDVQLDLRDRHKRWRLDRDNSRRLEAQSRNGTRSRPTTAHAAAVHKRSQRWLRGQTGRLPLEFGPACSSEEVGPAPAPTNLSPSNPSTKPQILMPNRHYLNVHSHYAKFSVHVELNGTDDEIKITDVMQSYDYGYLDTNHHIGFKRHRRMAKARMPARKAVDLENLAALSSPLAEEITHMNKVHGQAAIFARFRSERKGHAELQRRANRTPQHQVRSYKMPLGPLYARNGSKSDAPAPPITPANSPSDPGGTDAQSPEMSKACNGPQERRVRWVPNLIQQQQKVFDILQRRQRPPPIEKRRPSRAKSTLSAVTTASMGR